MKLTWFHAVLAAPVAMAAGIGDARAQDDFFIPRQPGLNAPPPLPQMPEDAAAAAAEAAAPDPTQTDPEVVRQGEVRLRLLQAQLNLLTGRYEDARDAYRALSLELPSSAEPMAGLGAVARETGRMRLARSHYQEAVRRDPDDRSAAESLAALERDRAPRLRADVEQRFQRGGTDASSADITVGEVGGAWNVGEAWRVGFAQGLSYVDADGVQRADGRVTPFTGSRVRTEIYATYEWLEGVSVTGSLYANEWSAGFGAAMRLPDDSGRTGLRVEYHRPIWDFVESIIEGAVRDRVSVERFQRITSALTLRLEGGYNRYGIPRDDDDVVQSATVRGELRLDQIAGVTGLSVAYALDGEYVTHDTTRFTAAGTPYQVLPVVDREVHAGLVSYGQTIGTPTEGGRLVWQVTAGYGADRYGRPGPLAFATLGYAEGNFEVAMRAGYVRNIGRSEGETTTLGLTLGWLF